MLEAAFYQLPVLGIQVLKDYNSQATDWVWSSTNDKKVAAELIRLVKSHEQRFNLAERQHTYVQKYHTIEAMTNAYNEFYKEVVERSDKNRKAPDEKGSFLEKFHSINQ